MIINFYNLLFFGLKKCLWKSTTETCADIGDSGHPVLTLFLLCPDSSANLSLLLLVWSLLWAAEGSSYVSTEMSFVN